MPLEACCLLTPAATRKLAIDSGNDMARTSSGRAASTSKPGQELDFRLFFLHRDREVLYRRCNARVTDMVRGAGPGWLGLQNQYD